MRGKNLWVIFVLHGKKENTWVQPPAYLSDWLCSLGRKFSILRASAFSFRGWEYDIPLLGGVSGITEITHVKGCIPEFTDGKQQKLIFTNQKSCPDPIFSSSIDNN